MVLCQHCMPLTSNLVVLYSCLCYLLASDTWRRPMLCLAQRRERLKITLVALLHRDARLVVSLFVSSGQGVHVHVRITYTCSIMYSGVCNSCSLLLCLSLSLSLWSLPPPLFPPPPPPRPPTKMWCLLFSSTASCVKHIFLRKFLMLSWYQNFLIFKNFKHVKPQVSTTFNSIFALYICTYICWEGCCK